MTSGLPTPSVFGFYADFPPTLVFRSLAKYAQVRRRATGKFPSPRKE